MSDTDAIDPKATEPSPAPSAEPEEPTLSPALMRFKRYFGNPVGLQLNYAVAMLDFSGDVMQMGDTSEAPRRGVLTYAMMQIEGKPEPVGTTHVLPAVMLQPSPDGEYLIGWIQSPTGALLEINLSPQDVRCVWLVARLPPPASRIVTAN